MDTAAESTPVSIRSPHVYVPVLAVTALVAGLGAWGDVALGPAALTILFVAVVLTGMPHGAVDHLVAAQLYGLDTSWVDQAKFYGGYLVLMALYGAFWVAAPVWSLGVFLVMTMYHFGQADLAYWQLPPVTARLVYLSRGLFLIGLPVAAFPGLVDPIFEAIAGVRPTIWPLLAGQPTSVAAGLVGQHVFVLAGAALMTNVAGRAAGREALNVAVLTALFGAVHPLVAFAVYFGLWHSLGHILELLRFFRRREAVPATIPGFYRKAALFTVLPFVGLAGLYWATQAFGSPDQMIALLFIIIAVMTLPHMVIVERLYRERERPGRPVGTG
jgi:Brp/Blh family beta-carotene 15,15'-monooxygenase